MHKNIYLEHNFYIRDIIYRLFKLRTYNKYGNKLKLR